MCVCVCVCGERERVRGGMLCGACVVRGVGEMCGRCGSGKSMWRVACGMCVLGVCVVCVGVYVV